LLEV
jgi:hypothetical protein